MVMLLMLLMLLAPRDAGVLLGVGTARVIEMERKGVLPCLRDSMGRRLFRLRDVQRVAAKRRRRGIKTQP